MAVLVQGGPQTWGLSSKPAANNNQTQNNKKNVVLVKLTDSSLRALEEYLKNPAVFQATDLKPTIKFPSGHNTGRIRIPLGTDGNNTAEFSFSLSSTDESQGPQSSFECLASTGGGRNQRKNGGGSLESIGQFQEKLQVRASDASYTRFEESMVKAKIESDKRTTQLLKHGGSGLSSKSGSSARRLAAAAAVNTNNPGSGSSFTKNTYSHAHARHNNSSSSSSSNNMDGGNGGSGTRGRGIVGGGSSGSAIARSPHGGIGTHPMLDRNSKNNSSPYPKQQHNGLNNPQLLKRPLKERIIHLLAVRPYKKPELMTRINRDGIREKERKNIIPILKQVSFMKDNTYNLLRHLWNEVSDDWAYYSDQERASFRRRKPQNLTPPFSDGSTSSSGHSPSSTHPASPPSSSTSAAAATAASGSSNSSASHHHHHHLKRPLSHGGGGGNGGGGGMGNGGIYDNDVNMTSKKRRVSNYVRPPDMATNSSGVGGGSPLSTLSANGKSPMRRSPSAFSGSGGTNGSSGSGSNTSLSNNKPGWSPNRHKSKVASSTSPDYYQQQQQQQQQQQPSQHHRSHQSPFGRGGNQDNTDGGNISSEHHSQQQQQQHHNTESAADEVEQQQPQPQRRVVNKYDSQDYMNQFTTISSKEQRVRYKAEFNSNYNEYRELHSLLHEVSRKFAVLEDQLKREQPGSEEWKKVKSKIFEAYQENKQDPRFSEAREKFKYLHSKLAYIKGLVSSYDSHVNNVE